MKYEFKRGQIVPKKLGSRFVGIHKKARHNILFGCDVEVTVTPTALKVTAKSEGAIFFVKRSPKRRRDNGTYQECNTIFSNIHAEPWPNKAPLFVWHDPLHWKDAIKPVASAVVAQIAQRATQKGQP